MKEKEVSRIVERKTCLYEHKKGRKLNLNLLPVLAHETRKSCLYAERFPATTFRPRIGVGNLET